MSELSEAVRAADVRAVGRACRIVDDRLTGHRELVTELFPHAGGAWVLGVTGGPGVGKSTLVDRLLVRFRAAGLRVGVLAVDPSSPFTGGALLGDRIRMQRHFADSGVFIRSVATRGARGGLSRSLAELRIVLEAAGFERIVIETVGVGQDELDVMEFADTTLVTLAPGLGDDVQALKAGLLEIADVFVVNKADRAGGDLTVRDLEERLELGRGALPIASGGHHAAHAAAASGAPQVNAGGWQPRIVSTVAKDDRGLDELDAALAAHRAWLATTAGQSVRRARRAGATRQLLAELLLERWLDGPHGPQVDELVQRIQERSLDPYAALDVLERVLLQRELTATK